MTKIKICGLSRPEDIRAVNMYRPDYAGFILGFPKSHRNISPADLIRLTADLDPSIKRVGVFVDPPLSAVVRLLEEGRIDIAQLHGKEDEACVIDLKSHKRKGQEIWKAFEVRTEKDLLKAAESPADRILLDAGKGGGTAFNWDLLKTSDGGRKARDRGYILAGGLGPDNLKEAVDTLHPAGVDLSSGVETDMVKDPDKIRECIRIVREER